MGIRETQYMGLSSAGLAWLETNCQKTEVMECPTCHYRTGGELIKVKHGVTHGMFMEEINLYEYKMINGKSVYEFVQASPWSSGPCIFIALSYSPVEESAELDESDEIIKESLYSNEEIESA